MRTILTTSLSVHWMAVFLLLALAAAPSGDEPLAVAAALATGHALVAALFLWTAIAAWGGGRCDEVAGLALGVAALVLAMAAALDGAPGGAAMQLAALGVTWLVIRALAAAESEPPAVDWSGEVARRLALGAAHGSMLSRLSRRGPAEDEA